MHFATDGIRIGDFHAKTVQLNVRSSVKIPSDFLRIGSWWNLYFAKGNDPLRRGNSSIHAVKIVQVDETRPSWVQIRFSKDRDDHLSIIGATAKVHDSGELSWEAALTEWEGTIGNWRTIWVNLDFVVRASKVEQNDTRDTSPQSVPNTNSSPRST